MKLHLCSANVQQIDNRDPVTTEVTLSDGTIIVVDNLFALELVKNALENAGGDNR